MAPDHQKAFETPLTRSDLFDAQGHFTDQLVAMLVERAPEKSYEEAGTTFADILAHCKACTACHKCFTENSNSLSFMKINTEDDGIFNEAVDLVNGNRSSAKRTLHSLMQNKGLTEPEYALEIL